MTVGTGSQGSDWRSPERRAATQSALFNYTDRLHRAQTRESVLEASLDAIRDTLACEVASILLFDDAEVMRFVAWRGLSDAYRKAAEGHSPWTAGQAFAQPIAIEDARKETFEPELAERLRTEGIQSLAFIPMLSGKGVTGKFMMYFGEPHAYAPEELDLAAIIARQLGFALERVEAERLLRESEARYRLLAHDRQLLTAIVESSEDAIVSKTLDGVIQSWNAGAERLFGYTPDEVVGKSISILFPADRMDEEPQILKRIRAGERVEHFDTIRKHKDGRLIDISLTISPVRDSAGTIVGASKIARDVTERKQTEKRLRRSEAEFRTLADNMSQLAWMTDREGWIYWYNKRWFDYTGATSAEMEGWGWQKVHHPDHVDRVTEKFKQHIAAGEPWEDTFPLRGEDGEYRWFLSRAMPIHDEDGGVLRWFGTNTDVTDQRRAEEQRTLLINELNHRVKNTLATVQSLAAQTLRGGVNNEDARTQFEARVQALSRAHDILTAQNWRGSTMRGAIERTVEPFNEQGRMSFDGPPVWLSPKQTLAFAIAIHELSTNAARYGALSGQDGVVLINWTLKPVEDEVDRLVELEWTEQGGPSVEPPERLGFGVRLIERGIARDLGADAHLEFLPEGVHAVLRSPVEAPTSPAFSGVMHESGR